MHDALSDALVVTIVAGAAPEVVRVRVRGDVDEEGAATLRLALRQLRRVDARRVEVDLSQATFFAHAGLVELGAAQQQVPGRIVLLNASHTVRKLVPVLGLDLDVA